MSDGTKRRLHGEHGAAAVEFALVWFVLALFLIGIIQFGFLFSQWLQIEHAAREGARWAGLRNEADFVRNKVIDTAPGLELTAADIDITPGDPTSAVPNTSITVTVHHDAPVFTPIMTAIFGTEVDLSATSTQRVE